MRIVIRVLQSFIAIFYFTHHRSKRVNLEKPTCFQFLVSDNCDASDPWGEG